METSLSLLEEISVVKQICDHDRDAVAVFCHQLLQPAAGNPDMTGNVVISDEAHFCIHSAINNPNFSL
jgi:hypothetical protein